MATIEQTQENLDAYGDNFSQTEPTPEHIQDTETSEEGDLAFLRSKGVGGSIRLAGQKKSRV